MLTATLAVTGPFARGLSMHASAPLHATDFTQVASRTTMNTGTAASRHCQRGVAARSGCSSDLGYVRQNLRIGSAIPREAFFRTRAETADDLWSTRLFRPPRLS